MREILIKSVWLMSVVLLGCNIGQTSELDNEQGQEGDLSDGVLAEGLFDENADDFTVANEPVPVSGTNLNTAALTVELIEILDTGEQ